MSFDNYCIVCDRLIVPPKQPEPEPPTKPKKKVAGGTIRVKNPDGTTTTRSANGSKVTRPGLRRNPTSANRLAALSGANGPKITPLTRSKTEGANGITPIKSTATGSSPQSNASSSPPLPCDTTFRSAIYCSRECSQTDAGRCDETYKDMARTLSFDFSVGHAPFGLEPIVTHSVPVTDGNQHAPVSPLFISGSDTSSSAAGGNDGPASSAPTLDYFRMSRPGSDETWHDIQRQRRSSMHPVTRPLSLARAQSSTSTDHPAADVSTDSLSSLWNSTSTEQELYLSRSTSTGPKVRPGDESSRRSMSSNSDQSAPIPARTPHLSRNHYSHTSLAASPNSAALFDGSGSVPNHTVNLLQSYALAFPSRDPTGAASFTQRGFATEARRSSTSHGQLQRSNNGTIRASCKRPSEREPTWDSFGHQEVKALNARARAAASAEAGTEGCNQPESSTAGNAHATPKQSLQVEDGRWKIKYHSFELDTVRPNRRRSSSRDTNGSRGSPEHHSGVTIPNRSRLSTSASSHSHSRTPHGRVPIPMASPSSGHGNITPSSSVPSRPNLYAVPDLASLRIGSSGCAPCVSSDTAVPTRSGFDWSAHERKGGKTYELPHGLKIDRSKAGLFYFQ